MVDAVGEETRHEPHSGIPFGKLRNGMCKFPLGRLYDPPERFCGEPTPVGAPYCEECRGRAYVRGSGRLGKVKAFRFRLDRQPHPTPLGATDE